MSINYDAKTLLEALEQSVLTRQRLQEMTDYDIAGLLFHFIWSEIDVFTPQSNLIDEAIRRISSEFYKEVNED